MGARESAAMIKARKLVLAGMTAYAAAKITGLSRPAIYQAKWYREFKLSPPCDGQPEKEQTGCGKTECAAAPVK